MKAHKGLFCTQNSVPGSNEECVEQTRKALSIAIPLVTACYMILGCAAYAAYASSVVNSYITIDLLIMGSHWAVNLSLILLLAHMLGRYQVS